MNLQRTLGPHSMTTLVLALGLTACDLGEKQIGDESGTDDGGDADADADADPIGPCGEVMISSLPSNSEDDFADPLDAFGGRSVDDILAIVEGNYAGTFTWDQPEDPVFVLADHAGTESPLTITATFAGGDAVLTEVALAGKWFSNDPFPTLCTNRLELDITLDFATADGVFDESLVVRVGVNSHIEPVDDGDPMFRHHLDLDAQQGSLAIEDFQVDGTLTDLVLGAAFLEAGMTGSTFAEVTNMHGIIGSTIASFDAPRVP